MAPKRHGGNSRWPKRDMPSHPIYAQSTDDICRAIAQRRTELRITQLELDDLAGLPDGYTSKVEGMRVYPVGLALTLYLQALGLVLVPMAAKHIRKAIRTVPSGEEQLALPIDLPTRKQILKGRRVIQAHIRCDAPRPQITNTKKEPS